jgi:cellulose synthase/poly-beta-1,6-N-acetylglucosamine synthase-like glycosyltransferase
MKAVVKYFFSILVTLFIFGLLGSVIFVFYFYRNGNTAESFFLSFILVTVLTDILYLCLHLFRKPAKHPETSFDPSKLTIVIACYNGEDIIGETIEGALKHVPAQQIAVVSDASTDKTAQKAYEYGVRVYVNRRNVNKAFSISSVMRWVDTPYVLILDDDTLIGKTFIPTSLLDEGYAAVAFNVMPVEQPGIINKLQRFEYRKSMTFSKSLRAGAGAIGNISGAIGLFRTEDLKRQAKLHSGQFGGEDQQRTALVHIYSRAKGVTYTDGLVETKAPNTPRALFRQRAFRWNLSLPELFSVYFRILVNPKHHYLLKVDKAYQIFLYTTDPLRVALLWMALFYPQKIFVVYSAYLFLSLATWIKLDRKDPLWVVFVFPFYRAAETVCRLIAHFYWFKIKFHYIFKEKFQRYVSARHIVTEYAIVTIFITTLWLASGYQAESRVNNLQNSVIRHNAPVQAVNISLSKVEPLVAQYAPSITAAQPNTNQASAQL